jgi:poly-gamma-glutamate synthesis protein (capsule biosynthesis protein)
MIIGGHPHVLQGIEIRNQVPIIYSLGNYWFNSASLDTCLVKVTFTKGKLSSWQFIPARQENCYTKVLDGSEKARVISYMRSLSPNVVIDDDGYLDISSIQAE